MSAQASAETISGLVERVTYHNADNGFCVLRVNVKGHKDLVTIIGNLSIISAGEYVQALGIWIHDRQHGGQFKSQFLKSTPPTSLEGIERYLGSGMIKGIGPIYAKKLVAAFGEKVFEIIEANPERLREVAGIGQSRANQVTKGWADQRIIRDIMLFLHTHKISTARAVRIYKTYGARAIAVITEDPYRLARDIRGIGFVSADTIAQEVGITKTSLLRARAGITYALTKAMDDGHCGLPEELLLSSCRELLDIPLELVKEALIAELALKTVIQETIDQTLCVFLGGLFNAERAIAKKLIALSKGPIPWPAIDTLAALRWVEEKSQVCLSQTQKQAIEVALTSKVMIITGGPGVGKTTLVNLLPRFVQPSSGQVFLQGAEIQDWPLQQLRQQFAMVSQDVVMLNDTVAANIALGQTLDRAKIQACLAAANLDEHVAKLPQGMDTLLGHNATELSGGQRQRLAIARALYKNAPILILDEATSALDNESERWVQEALHNLMKGRTTLIIAHRLSTIEHADRVIVMSQGEIVEQGRHEELLKAGGVYSRLHHKSDAA